MVELALEDEALEVGHALREQDAVQVVELVLHDAGVEADRLALQPLCYSSVWLSMNVLSLDEKTVCVEASEGPQMDQLDRLGFEVIPVPFRDAYPFGGGLHCATADVWREGDRGDWFPHAA